MKRFLEATLVVCAMFFVVRMGEAAEAPAPTPTLDLSGDNSDEWLTAKDEKGRVHTIPVVDLRGKRRREWGEVGWNEYLLPGKDSSPYFQVKEWVFTNDPFRADVHVYIKDDDGVAILWLDRGTGIYRFDKEKKKVQVVIDFAERKIDTRTMAVLYDNTKTYFAFLGFDNVGAPVIVFNSKGEILWERDRREEVTTRKGKKRYCIDGVLPGSKGYSIMKIRPCEELETYALVQIWDMNGRMVAELPQEAFRGPYWYPDGEHLDFVWLMKDEKTGEWARKRSVFDRFGNWVGGDKP